MDPVSSLTSRVQRSVSLLIFPPHLPVLSHLLSHIVDGSGDDSDPGLEERSGTEPGTLQAPKTNSPQVLAPKSFKTYSCYIQYVLRD